jgi:hypothetical protein
MSREQDEVIDVDIGDMTPRPEYLPHMREKLHVWRAFVSHFIAVILVSALVLSIPLYVLLVCWYPEQNEPIRTAFEKWYAVMSPFVGLAIGAYYGARKASQ